MTDEALSPDVPKKQPIPGFASEDLHFDSVEGPEGYPSETDGPVNAVAVSVNGLPAGFLWKGKDESLGFERAARARPQANNLAVSINTRLLEGYESGLSAAETFTKTTIWLEQEWVVPASVDPYTSLDRIRQLASEANPVTEVSVLSRIQGSLLGGAIGEALGYPVRTARGAISDDTQTKSALTVSDRSACASGTVTRSARFGLVPSWTTEKAFDEAFLASKITHCHPTAAASAGVFAALVRGLSSGTAFGKSLRGALQFASRLPGGASDETIAAVRRAVALAGDGGPSFEKTETLGGGWIAEEALAIAVYCVLSYPERDEVHRALTMAVTHSGDSDSTGSICGNLLGALHGREALPAALVEGVEGRDALLAAAATLVADPFE